MSHDHHHGHSHHDHLPEGEGRSKKILFAAILNISFTIIEIIGGILTNSVAILSDAVHDLGDSLSLVTAYIAEKQSERPADAKRTFGYARFSLFSAFFAALVLLIGSSFIFVEAIKRLFEPEPVHAGGMVLLAVFGIIVNYIAYRKLHGGHSANEKVLTTHLLEDILGWVAVLVGAVIIYFTDFYLIDPILTVGYTIFIVWHVIGGLKEVIHIFMQGMPHNFDMEEISKELTALVDVLSVHDVHVWSLDGERNVFTGHIVVATETPASDYADVRKVVVDCLSKHNIVHSTIEIEPAGDCPGDDCGLKS